MKKTVLSRREFLRGMGLAAGATVLAACQPEVIKETVIVKETVMVEGEPVEVTKIVEQEVEKVVKETVVVEVAPTPEPSELAMWMPSYATLAGYVEPALPRFQEDHPEIQIDLQVMPWDAWEQKWAAEISAGRGPDIGLAHGSGHARQLEVAGALMVIPEAVMSRAYIEETWVPAALGTSTWKGKYYFLPREWAGWSWKAHRILMDDAEIADLPTSYGEHLELMEKTTKFNEDGDMIQSGTAMHSWTYSWFCTNYLSAGGEKVFDTQPDKQVAVFNNDLGVASFKAITDLVTEYHFWEPEFPGGYEGFLSGKTATLFIGGWASGIVIGEHPEWPIDAYSFEVGVPTVGPDGPKVFSWPGWGWVVLSGSKNPPPAWTLWTWLYSTDELVKQTVATGETCPIKPVVQALEESDLFTSRPDLVWDFRDVERSAYEDVWNSTEVEREFVNARDRVILQGISVEESLDIAEQAMNLAIAEAFTVQE